MSFCAATVLVVICAYSPYLLFTTENWVILSILCSGIGFTCISVGIFVAGIYLRIIVPACTSSRTWCTLRDMHLVHIAQSTPRLVFRELEVDLLINSSVCG